jgi:hypothetical protein
MLAAEHEEAEVLRRARLKAYAPRRPVSPRLRWFLQLLGQRASNETAPRSFQKPIE